MPITPGRAETVNRARDQWVCRLIDLSRRNRLLYFRELKTGTLDLSEVSETLVPSLIRADQVRLSDLFGEDEQRAVVGRLLEIRRKAVENLEEKGLDTMHVALGVATWAASDGGRPPASPVLLAFTYDWLACEDERRPHVPWIVDDIDEDDMPIMHDAIRFMRNEGGLDWSHRWRRREF